MVPPITAVQVARELQAVTRKLISLLGKPMQGKSFLSLMAVGAEREIPVRQAEARAAVVVAQEVSGEAPTIQQPVLAVIP